MKRVLFASSMILATSVALAQDPPPTPEMQEGYVCSVFLHDIGMPRKALVFALTSQPDCHGEWEQHNFVCPDSGGQSTNPYACGNTEYTAAEQQMIHDELMAASARRLRFFAVQGKCQAVEATHSCFAEVGYMNFPAVSNQAARSSTRALARARADLPSLHKEP